MASASNTIRRVGITLLALMLVSSMVAPSAMAASTSMPDDPCQADAVDIAESWVTLGLVGLYDGAKCQGQQRAAQQFQNATWADLYVSGLAQDDLGKSARVPIQNHLEDSKTFSRTIAKTEAVKLFNNESNGLSESEIKASVNDSIEEYYAKMQENLLTTHEANIHQAWYVYIAHKQAGLNQATLARSDEEAPPSDGSDVLPYSDDKSKWYNDTATFTLEAVNVTLADGSEMNISVIKELDGGTYPLYTDPTNQTDEDYKNYREAFYIANPDAQSWGPDSEDEMTAANSIEMYDEHQYAHTWWEINQTLANSKTEAAAFVDLLYQNYNRSSGVDVSEVLNPNDLATQWNTNYNTTGYYGWIAATLGMTGLEGNVNASFAINYTPRVNHTDNGNFTLNGSGTHDYAFENGESYNISGTLMTDWDPNPNESYSFERGSSYDTANANAPVLFIEQVDSNSSRVVRLNGTFTIDTLTNVRNGTEINSTSLEEQNYQTWNESSSVTEIQNLIEYRNKSVTIVEAGGGGTGGGGGFGFDFGAAGMGFIVIAAGGALLVLSNRP